jgi:osmotically-inducible protein OsmY
MNKDRVLKERVEQELTWNPAISEGHIAVAAHDGVVTLAGSVETFLERLEAEQSAKRVSGVAGVANEIDVKMGSDIRPDADIVKDAVAALNLQLPHSAPHIRVIVSEGRLKLEGTVEWNYLRERAAESVRTVRGVRAVANQIALKSGPLPRDVQNRIVAAFHRSADIDAHSIHVEADGDRVTLHGKVTTWAEREAAERVAWHAPGVNHVFNHIAIAPRD